MARSKNLTSSIALVYSVRKPGHVYKFYKTRDNQFRCQRCDELGKCRAITIVDDVIVGRKHPEDGHHADCESLPEAVVNAEQLDREMRHDVRETGKRPREAYNEMMSSVPKRFKSSDVQSQVVHKRTFIVGPK